MKFTISYIVPNTVLNKNLISHPYCLEPENCALLYAL